MVRLLLSISIVLISLSLKSQDTIRLHHKEYSSLFSKSLKYPVEVEWWLTKAKVTCTNPLPRKDQFQPDPLLPAQTNLANDYKGSGFDRGHVSPAADNQCSGPEPLKECFYFSNMLPQYHSLNAGDWKSLETYTRDLASKNDSIKVWAGGVGEVKRIGSVAVPEKCWKVLYIKSTKEWIAYVFINDQSKPDGMANNKTTVDEIKKLTHLEFKIK